MPLRLLPVRGGRGANGSTDADRCADDRRVRSGRRPAHDGGAWDGRSARVWWGRGSAPRCLQEFIKLREDVQKKGQAAKALSEHKPSREEMCKQITVYAAAETKWVKYTESNAANCGIPAQLVQELRNVHGHTEQTREKICQPGVASGAPPPPSLSDALGTARLPTPETTRAGGGTFDTLTGNAIMR